MIGGVTISKAAFINQNSALSLDDINEWQDVRMLIIDEISFMSDSVLKRLDKKLKQIGNAARVFGGFSIIFSGDFRQLERAQMSTEFFWHEQVKMDVLEMHLEGKALEYWQVKRKEWTPRKGGQS